MSQSQEQQQYPADMPPVTVFRRTPDLPGAAYIARVGADLAHRYQRCSHDEYGEYVLASVDQEGRVLDFGYRYPEARTGWRGESQLGRTGPSQATLSSSEAARSSAQAAEAVWLSFRTGESEETLQAIANCLDGQRFRTVRGADFAPKQVHEALRREPFYRSEGVLARSYEAERGAHEPLLAGRG